MPARSPMPLIVHSTWRACFDASQAVGDSQAQVVVAMGADNRPVDTGHPLLERANDPGVLLRRGVADGVWNVDGGCAGFDGGLHHVAEEVELSAGGIFGAELDVGAISLGACDSGDGLLNDLRLGHSQLVFAMNGRSGQKDVNSRLLRETGWLPRRGRCRARCFAPSRRRRSR